MKPFSSPFFYLPLLALFAISNAIQDIGLWMRYLALSAGALALLWSLRKQAPEGLGALALLLLGLVFWNLTGWSGATSKGEWWAHVARFAFLFGLAGWSARVFKSAEESAISGLALGSQFTLLFAALSVLPSLAEAYREGDIYLAHGPLFLHKNYAAAYLLMLVPLAVSQKAEGAWKYLQYAAVGLAVVDIFLLRTRGVWLALLLMSVVAVVYFAAKKSAQWRNRALGAFGVVATGIVVTALVVGQEKIIDSGTLQSRFHYWNASWDLFLNEPITGVGGGQWKIAYPGTGLKGTNELVMNGATNILRPHNDVLWVLSEMGAPGAAAFVAALLLGLIGAWRGGQIFYALVVVAFAGYGLAEFPLERATTLWPLAVVFGFVLSKEKSLVPLPGVGSTALVGGALALMLGVSYLRVDGEKSAKKVIEAYTGGPANTLLRHAQAAPNACFDMDIFNNPFGYFEGVALLRSAGGQMPGAEVLKKVETATLAALQVHPNHILSLAQLADLYKNQGRYAEAKVHYEHLLQISPGHLRGALGLTEVYRREGDLNRAVGTLHRVFKRYTPENTPPLAREGLATLQAFARQPNPHPAFAELHRSLQGKSGAQLWTAWMQWREMKWAQNGGK